jgi:hypothetical protein
MLVDKKNGFSVYCYEKENNIKLIKICKLMKTVLIYYILHNTKIIYIVVNTDYRSNTVFLIYP